VAGPHVLDVGASRRGPGSSGMFCAVVDYASHGGCVVALAAALCVAASWACVVVFVAARGSMWRRGARRPKPPFFLYSQGEMIGANWKAIQIFVRVATAIG
jgi:hypothetical protein